MGTSKETAEERLLRMIEGPVGSGSPRKSVRQMTFNGFIAQTQVWWEALWRRAIPSYAYTRNRSDTLLIRLQLAQRLMWLILAALGFYIIVDLLLFNLKPPTLSLSPLGGSVQGSHPSRVTTLTAEERLKPLEQYRDLLVRRNPFGLSSSGSEGAVIASSGKTRLEELTQTLTVVGINRGREPEALIEDSSIQRTHFLKVADQLNGLTVKSIDERGVTLTDGHEEILLQ